MNKHYSHSIVLLAILFSQFACKEHKSSPLPINEASSENLIAIQSGQQNMTYFLDGQTGEAKWSLDNGLASGYISDDFFIDHFKVADRKVLRYPSLPEQHLIVKLEEWADTLSLFSKPSTDEFIHTIDASNGSETSKVPMLLKPRFWKGCNNGDMMCSSSRWYYWMDAADGVVIITSVQSRQPDYSLNVNLNAVDYKTGQLMWTFKVDSQTCSVHIEQGRVYVGDSNRSYVLDLKSGTRQKEYNIGGLIPPFDSNRYFRPVGAGKIFVCDPQTGAVRWEAQVSNKPEDVLITKNLVLTKAMEERYIQARNSSTGQPAWQLVAFESGGFEAMKYQGDTLYAMTKNLRLQAIDLKSGNEIWRTKMFGTGMYCVMKNMIYLAQGHQIIGLDKANGEKIWECFFRRDDASEGIRDMKVYNRSELDF